MSRKAGGILVTNVVVRNLLLVSCHTVRKVEFVCPINGQLKVLGEKWLQRVSCLHTRQNWTLPYVVVCEWQSIPYVVCNPWHDPCYTDLACRCGNMPDYGT